MASGKAGALMTTYSNCFKLLNIASIKVILLRVCFLMSKKLDQVSLDGLRVNNKAMGLNKLFRLIGNFL